MLIIARSIVAQMLFISRENLDLFLLHTSQMQYSSMYIRCLDIRRPPRNLVSPNAWHELTMMKREVGHTEL